MTSTETGNAITDQNNLPTQNDAIARPANEAADVADYGKIRLGGAFRLPTPKAD